MIKFTKIKFTYSLLITLFAITVFLSGFVVVLNGGIRNVSSENMESQTESESPSSCPDLLIKQDNKLMLNTKMPKEEGLILYCLTRWTNTRNT
jgi:hypothetical protein